jgi:hypothetical protein
MPGTVPEYEERETARFLRYHWSDWQRLPMRERAMGVAQHRLSRLIALHESDALNEEMERRSRRAQRQRGAARGRARW